MVMMAGTNHGVWALVAAAAFIGLLWTDADLGALLPLLFLLACPLMMFFMMKGMHGGEGHQHAGQRADEHDHDPTGR
jgi:hypothetical protein